MVHGEKERLRRKKNEKVYELAFYSVCSKDE